MLNFQHDFVLEVKIDVCNNTESREVFWNRTMYYFSFSYNSIDKSDILEIHKYLMIKNNIKSFQALLNKCLFYYWIWIHFYHENEHNVLSLNDEPYMARPNLIDLNPVEQKYYPFMISLYKCSENCNVLTQKYGFQGNQIDNC